MKKIINKCKPIEREGSFLWSKYKWLEETHEWAYFDDENRICEKCGYEEVQIKYIDDDRTGYKWVKKAQYAIEEKACDCPCHKPSYGCSYCTTLGVQICGKCGLPMKDNNSKRT